MTIPPRIKAAAFCAILITGVLCVRSGSAQNQAASRPWIWPSEPPPDCPFERSQDLVGVAFTGRHSDYKVADTFYPSWASDDRLYSPYTDGSVARLDGGREQSNSGRGQYAATGQAVLEGDDPLNLKIYSLGTTEASALPYSGRYPCGSLVHNGVWYYGTYTLSPDGRTTYAGIDYNWPWLGPLVGFRISTDFGRTWKETPHTPAKSLFGENGLWGEPVKIGAPHFVDFGKNMEQSPDGNAYLVAHGAADPDPKPRFANLSWISGDQIYLLRVKPSIETINDASKYEFFGGHDNQGRPVWTRHFREIKPLIDWNNSTGVVTLTYNAPLRRYLMCVTDGWPTYKQMHTYILESTAITGPWKLVTYMKNFGEQAYFVNIPAKFIGPDGRKLWLAYSANFARGWNNVPILSNPPGSRYGLVLQEMVLLDRRLAAEYANNPRPQATAAR